MLVHFVSTLFFCLIVVVVVGQIIDALFGDPRYERHLIDLAKVLLLIYGIIGFFALLAARAAEPVLLAIYAWLTAFLTILWTVKWFLVGPRYLRGSNMLKYLRRAANDGFDKRKGEQVTPRESNPLLGKKEKQL